MFSMNRLSIERRAQILAMLTEGNSMRVVHQFLRRPIHMRQESHPCETALSHPCETGGVL